jgi:hypothetical protein
MIGDGLWSADFIPRIFRRIDHIEACIPLISPAGLDTTGIDVFHLQCMQQSANSVYADCPDGKYPK